MKTSKSIRRELAIGLLGGALLLVGIYTILLPYYLTSGAKSAVAVLLQFELAAFDDALKQDPDAQFPELPNTWTYVGFDALPERVLRIFPAEDHEPGEALAEDENEESGDIFLFIPYDLHTGERMYLLRMITEEQTDEFAGQFDSLFLAPWIVGLALVLVLVGFARLLNRRVEVQMNSLAAWADALTLDDYTKPRPDFRFDELNRIADHLRDAFQRIGEVLAREQQFLRFASHELRTPLAVIRMNMELLIKQRQTVLTETPAFDRIHRSTESMRQLTETLLWLSRPEGESLLEETFDLAELTEQIVADHRYLIAGKTVEIRFVSDPVTVAAVKVPCAMVIANLVRNAFQHTDDGAIDISVADERVVIANSNRDGAPSMHSAGDSYGLGLLLVENITTRMGWGYTATDIPGGRQAVLTFVKSAVPAD